MTPTYEQLQFQAIYKSRDLYLMKVDGRPQVYKTKPIKGPNPITGRQETIGFDVVLFGSLDDREYSKLSAAQKTTIFDMQQEWNEYMKWVEAQS